MQSVNSRIRGKYEALMMPAGELLLKLRISPNRVSALSLVFAGVSCVSFALGRLVMGLAFLVVSVVVDMLDGSVARASGKVSPLGMVIDHTADRYAEFLYLFGLCYGGYVPFWLGFLCFFSMLMPSYVRAKIESSGTGLSCQGVGIAERKEKLAILIVCIGIQAFISQAIFFGLVTITLISQISTLQRLYRAFVRGFSDGTKSTV